MEFKKQLFCIEYIRDLNAERARKECNISASAFTLLNDPDIKVEISRLITERARATMIDAERVMSMLLQNAQDAAAAKDWTASNSALKLLGEHLGMFNKKPSAPAVQFNFGRDALPQGDVKVDEDLPIEAEAAEVVE